MFSDLFKGRKVFVVGSGPSLAGFDFSLLDGEKVIAINHSYKLLKHDLHVFYDASFLQEARGQYSPKTHTSRVLAGRNSGAVESENVQLFRRSPVVTRQFKDGLYMGYSSALPAINAALILGAKEVYLLGIDCRFLSDKEVREAARKNGNPSAAEAIIKDGFSHHVTQNTVNHSMDVKDKERKYTQMAAQFNAFAPYPVFNLSQFSQIQLPFKKLETVIKTKKEVNYGNN